jgi:RES domain-containing protein
MQTAFRIFKTKRAVTWFDGEGAFLFGGRWNTRGTRLLYASASLSLAALEMLVHLNREHLLLSYSYAPLEFDERSVLAVEDFQQLPANWSDSPPPIAVQQIGEEWERSKTSLVLRVPTAILHGEYNYLINISHPDFSKVKLGKPSPFHFDARLSNRSVR